MARRRVARDPDAISPAPFVGMALMAASFFLYGATLLVAPWWATVLMLLVWFVQFVLCCRWWTPRPTRLPWVAVFSMVLWFVLVVLGAKLWGWS